MKCASNVSLSNGASGASGASGISISSSSAVCVVRMTDTHFSSNQGTESLAVQLDCDASPSCDVSFLGCTFTNNSFVGSGASNALSAALQVTALDPLTSLTLSLTSCDFAYNYGAGLASNSITGMYLVSNCSFVGQQGGRSGLPALSISGASAVTLISSSWLGNSMGAIALSQVQSSVLVSSSSMSDNLASPITLSAVDIVMRDLSPSSVSFLSCSFVNNSGTSVWPAVQGRYNGAGAVNIWSGSAVASLSSISVTVQDSSFDANNGALMAGALSILTAASVVINNTAFSNNQGGGLFQSSVYATSVHSSAFLANSGTGNSDNSFVSTGGGAISSRSCNHTVIANSTFSSNVALNNGGAISVVTVDDAHSSLNVLGCSFSSNKAKYGSGGGVFVNGVDDISIVSSSFTGSSAAVAGGSVFVIGASMGRAYINLCSFVGSEVGVLTSSGWRTNSSFALGPDDVSLQPQLQGGGSVFASNMFDAAIASNTFENCSSVRSKGGGIRIRACQRATLSLNSFAGCRAAAGGAVSVSSMLQDVNQETGFVSNNFTSNVASTQLGCPSPVCVELDTTLVGTQGDGGAVSLEGSSILVYNINNFVNNSASGRGGAIFAQRSTGTSVITLYGESGEPRNFATPGGLPYLVLASFINNSASVAGGALALQGYALNLTFPLLQAPNALLYTLFTGNTAPTGDQGSLRLKHGCVIVARQWAVTSIKSLHNACLDHNSDWMRMCVHVQPFNHGDAELETVACAQSCAILCHGIKWKFCPTSNAAVKTLHFIDAHFTFLVHA